MGSRMVNKMVNINYNPHTNNNRRLLIQTTCIYNHSPTHIVVLKLNHEIPKFSLECWLIYCYNMDPAQRGGDVKIVFSP